VVSNKEEIGRISQASRVSEKENLDCWCGRRDEMERRGQKGFCTRVHRFAQEFDTNLIDGANGKYYFASQIEPGSLRTLRINLEGATSLTAVASRD
jgi:hypothetical protein